MSQPKNLKFKDLFDKSIFSKLKTQNKTSKGLPENNFLKTIQKQIDALKLKKNH